MRKAVSGLALAAALASVAACGGGSNSSPVVPTTTITDTVTGVVPAPINGVFQSSSNNFTVGQSGGGVTIILSSAVERLADGSIFSTSPVMGLGVGTPSGSTCTLSASTPIFPTQPGATSGIAASLNPGSYCVQVSDQSNQLGPVSYTLIIQHP